MKLNEVLEPKAPHPRREEDEPIDDKSDPPGYPKGEFDLRKLTRNPNRRGARVPPVHSDRPPRGPVKPRKV